MGEVTIRRLGISIGALVLAVSGALAPALVAPARAAEATFGTPTATFDYGHQVTFKQPVTLAAQADRVEILIDYPGALGPNVTEVPGATSSGSRTLSFTLQMAQVHLLPNTPLKARWRVHAGADVVTGPDVSLLYTDTGFKWRTQAGSLVTIHWYDGDAAFGQRALDIAEQGVRKAEDTLGVTEKDPIDFFVYADAAPFVAALGPGTPDTIVGQAHSEIRTMFALINPDGSDATVQEVVPHELTHLVFNTAVDNPYHAPPHWLNEGLAVYLSRGYDADDRAMVAAAARDGSLTPLNGLAGNYPTSSDRIFLAYAEGVSAVDFIVRAYGKPALVALVNSYAKGVTDDQAFTAALKVDTTGFTAAWLADLKAKTPVKVGPKAAPAGPLPAGWGGSVTPGSTAAPGAPGSTSGPSPTPVPIDGAGSGSDSPALLLVAGIVALVVIGGGAVLLARRRPGGGGA